MCCFTSNSPCALTKQCFNKHRDNLTCYFITLSFENTVSFFRFLTFRTWTARRMVWWCRSTLMFWRYTVRITGGISVIPSLCIMILLPSRKCHDSIQSALRHDRLFLNPFQFFIHRYRQCYSLDVRTAP